MRTEQLTNNFVEFCEFAKFEKQEERPNGIIFTTPEKINFVIPRANFPLKETSMGLTIQVMAMYYDTSVAKIINYLKNKQYKEILQCKIMQ